ncbi:MAG: L-serine ammonia-lyase, iron-sulfur-dependent, subunit alpha [Thermotogota bacterium]|nr:L-serine ammonia-lyase, iron-sulfur-dependent, subunit alpha [Thermotogota bacterium]
MITNATELIKQAQKKGVKIWEIILEEEVTQTGIQAKKLRKKMKKHLDVMEKSAQKTIKKPVKTLGGIIGAEAKKLTDYRKKELSICGDTINLLMARAFSTSEVNASMGKICAAPTAGSSGILPAVIITAAEVLEANEEDKINALFTAAGIGRIIATHATISGAEGGCQAECGSAASMGAGAVVEMAGGTPEKVFHAGAIALKNIMGLICDPVAGLVESPCAKRNASGAVNAFISAEQALAGIQSVISFDEVVEAMNFVGKAIPYEFRETALGGIAATDTAKEITKRIFTTPSS